MSREMRGLHRAQVVNTEEFQDTGKIRIHILGLGSEEAWEDAEMLTPFGGLPNMGISMVPPIGAHGFVLFERGKDDTPVWMGGLLNYFGTSQEEGWARSVEGEDPTDFIIKTQYTKFDERDVDLNSNKVENIIKMNENELTIAKVKQGDDYEYKKESYDLEEQAYNLLKITDEEIKIKFKFAGNNKSNSISVTETKASLTFDTDVGDMEIKVEEEALTLKAGNATIVLNKNGDIIISGDKEIHLNGTGGSATIYEGFRDFVNKAYNSHTHGSPSGPTSPPTKPYSSTKSAKSEDVKLS